ncbi:LptA/OstA family protein [Candidatus Magnetominusculus dajiuhuensis]|uniref:LptA/OstA family protein n=1 Tax=Candidatus Magnetominusculus dajiuhuensis TaxID=3137712 RepID=UPI003B434091
MKTQGRAALVIKGTFAVIAAAIVVVALMSSGALAADNTTTKKAAKMAKTADPAGGSSFKKSLKGDNETPLIITSSTLMADNKKRTATFNGSVKAVKGDITFFADTMVVFYTEDKNQQIDHIDSKGNIRLIQGDKIITSEQAVYYGANERVVFTGRPEAKEGKNIVTGTKIEYFFETDVSYVENSRVHLEEKK